MLQHALRTRRAAAKWVQHRARSNTLGTYGETIDYQESLAKNYIDSGGHIIRSINLSRRDHSGNVLPLGEHNWSAQIVFGYPE